jgi:hypothetical protein
MSDLQINDKTYFTNGRSRWKGADFSRNKRALPK